MENSNNIEKIINKIVFAIIGILLTIIGWFCSQTYQRICEMNIKMTKIEIELAKIQTQQDNFVTKVEMIKYLEEHIKN